MKEWTITTFTGRGTHPCRVPLAAVVEKMKQEQIPEVEKLSGGLHGRPTQQELERMVKRIPRFSVASLWEEKRRRTLWVGYTGLVTVGLTDLSGEMEVEQLRHQVSQFLHTLLAFKGLSDRSLFIVFAFSLPDGTLPQERKMAEWFHAYAYRRMVQYLRAQLNRYIEEKKVTPDQQLRMTHDRGLYYNPDAIVLTMEQPLQPPGEPTHSEKLQEEKDSISRLLPGFQRSRAISVLYEVCFRKVREEIGYPHEEIMKPFLIRLATETSRTGLPEEDVIKHILLTTLFGEHEMEVRLTVRNVYACVLEEKGDVEKLHPFLVNRFRFMEFLKRRYQFRYNVLKECVEYYRYRSFSFDFVPLTNRELNGITEEAHSEGLYIWDRDIRRFMESDRIAPFNPLLDYLSRLPAWDGKDHIRALAARIHTSRLGWEEQFYKWFVYMVAQWMYPDEMHANSTVPVLIGKQGYHKSTFCKMLLPPELRDYYKEQLDIRKKSEVDWALSRFALINLDEFDSIRPTDHNLLKHILQKTEVLQKDNSVRSRLDVRKRRIASFIATCNSYDVLSDPTGSRRYICLELTKDFDFDRFPDYAQLYAQAKAAIERNEQYWFTPEEEMDIMEANTEFQQIPLTEELFLLYFRRADENEEYEVLTCTEILMKLKKLSRAGFEINQRTKTIFARTLKKLNITSHRIDRGSGYRVKQIRFE